MISEEMYGHEWREPSRKKIISPDIKGPYSI